MIRTESPRTVDTIGLAVAVIVSSNTASSGEYVLMSFMDRPNTRIFGSPTFGATTGNDHLTLSDGASMLVAVASATNRSGEPYNPLSPIDPDELSENTDPALTWLLGQPPCQD
jgi:carboxyl-terminal processing protease